MAYAQRKEVMKNQFIWGMQQRGFCFKLPYLASSTFKTGDLGTVDTGLKHH